MSLPHTVGSWEVIRKTHHAVHQTFREDGHLVLSSQSMVFLTCFGGEGKQSSRKRRCLFPLSERDRLTPAVQTIEIRRGPNANKQNYLT